MGFDLIAWPDMHLPLVHEYALREALSYTKHVKPSVFVQLGDMFDCKSVSRHGGNTGRFRAFVDELDMSWSLMLKPMKAIHAFAKKVHFLEGNHELWLRRYVWDRAPALEGLVRDDPFRLRQNGFTVNAYRTLLRVGKVYFNHDIGGSGPRAAQQALNVVQGNIVQGHTHRASLVFETNGKGVSHFGCTAGWLGDPSAVADYMSPTVASKNWTHSLVHLRFANDGTASVSLVPLF